MDTQDQNQDPNANTSTITNPLITFFNRKEIIDGIEFLDNITEINNSVIKSQEKISKDLDTKIDVYNDMVKNVYERLSNIGNEYKKYLNAIDTEDFYRLPEYAEQYYKISNKYLGIDERSKEIVSSGNYDNVKLYWNSIAGKDFVFSDTKDDDVMNSIFQKILELEEKISVDEFRKVNLENNYRNNYSGIKPIGDKLEQTTKFINYSGTLPEGIDSEEIVEDTEKLTESAEISSRIAKLNAQIIEDKNQFLDLISQFFDVVTTVRSEEIRELKKSLKETYEQNYNSEAIEAEKEQLNATITNLNQNIDNFEYYIDNVPTMIRKRTSDLETNIRSRNDKIRLDTTKLKLLQQNIENTWPQINTGIGSKLNTFDYNFRFAEAFKNEIDDSLKMERKDEAKMTVGRRDNRPYGGSCGPVDNFEFSNYQRFVGEVVSNSVPISGLILYWSVGTGKTLGMISAISSFFSNNFYNSDLCIIFMPAGVVSAWKNDLKLFYGNSLVQVDIKDNSSPLFREYLNFNVEYATGYYDNVTFEPEFAFEIEGTAKYIIGIDPYNSDYRLAQFLWNIEKKIGTINENTSYVNSKSNRFKLEGQEADYEEFIKNSPLYLFDEYHNFFNSSTDVMDDVKTLIKNLHFSKKIAATATPVSDEVDYSKFAEMVNFIRFRPSDKNRSKFENYFGNPPSPDSKLILEDFVKGAFSYVSLNFDQSVYPFFNYYYFCNDKDGVCMFDPNTMNKFSDPRFNISENMKILQANFVRERNWPKVIPMLAMVKATKKPPGQVPNILKSLNACPPEDGVYCYTQNYSKLLGLDDKIDAILGMVDGYEGKHSIVTTVIKALNPGDELASKSFTIKKIVSKIKQKFGGGGYEFFDYSPDKNILPPYSRQSINVTIGGVSIGQDPNSNKKLNKSDLDELIQYTASTIENNFNDFVEGWYSTNVKEKRIMIINPIPYNNNTIAGKFNTLYTNLYLSIFNDPRNYKGEYIKVIFLGPEYIEGVSLFDVEYQHNYFPSQSFSLKAQSEGRPMRKCAWKNIAYNLTITDEVNGKLEFSGGVFPDIKFITYIAYSDDITVAPEWQIFNEIYGKQTEGDEVNEIIRQTAIDNYIFGEYSGSRIRPPSNIKFDVNENEYSIIDDIMLRALTIIEDNGDELDRLRGYIESFYDVTNWNPMKNVKNPGQEDQQLNTFDDKIQMARDYALYAIENITENEDFFPILVYWLDEETGIPDVDEAFGAAAGGTTKGYDISEYRAKISSKQSNSSLSLGKIGEISDALVDVSNEKIMINERLIEMNRMSNENKLVRPFDYVLVKLYGDDKFKTWTPEGFYSKAIELISESGYEKYKEFFGIDDAIVRKRERILEAIGPLAESWNSLINLNNQSSPSFNFSALPSQPQQLQPQVQQLQPEQPQQQLQPEQPEQPQQQPIVQQQQPQAQQQLPPFRPDKIPKFIDPKTMPMTYALYFIWHQYDRDGDNNLGELFKIFGSENDFQDGDSMLAKLVESVKFYDNNPIKIIPKLASTIYQYPFSIVSYFEVYNLAIERGIGQGEKIFVGVGVFDIGNSVSKYLTIYDEYYFDTSKAKFYRIIDFEKPLKFVGNIRKIGANDTNGSVMETRNRTDRFVLAIRMISMRPNGCDIMIRAFYLLSRDFWIDTNIPLFFNFYNFFTRAPSMIASEQINLLKISRAFVISDGDYNQPLKMFIIQLVPYTINVPIISRFLVEFFSYMVLDNAYDLTNYYAVNNMVNFNFDGRNILNYNRENIKALADKFENQIGGFDLAFDILGNQIKLESATIKVGEEIKFSFEKKMNTLIPLTNIPPPTTFGQFNIKCPREESIFVLYRGRIIHKQKIETNNKVNIKIKAKNAGTYEIINTCLDVPSVIRRTLVKVKKAQ